MSIKSISGGRIDLRCDYCDENILGAPQIPAGWLSCRFRERESPNIGLEYNSSIPTAIVLEDGTHVPVTGHYIPGPTACPYHVQQLKLVLTGF